MSERAGAFFDAMGGIAYDEAIVRCVPRYAEMLAMLLHYLPDDLNPRRILELGPGSGNLTQVIDQKYPDAELTLVDLSGELLQRCQERFGDRPGVHVMQDDMAKVTFPEGHFDLVLSTIAIHHLTDVAKAGLFLRAWSWLREGGILSYSDQFAGVAADVTAKHHRQWQEGSRALGATDEEWVAWMDHQRESDHHATLADQMRWLTEAGFVQVDCTWRHLLWTILQARKGERARQSVSDSQL